jgi:hypothetical protein
MSDRKLIRFGLNGIAGFLSFAVLGFGLYSAWGIDARFNPVLSTLYYVLPIASFPVFLIGLFFRKAAVLQPILAVVFLAVYAALNFRTCSALGYCSSIASIIWMTLTTRASLAFLGAAVASLAAMALKEGH